MKRQEKTKKSEQNIVQKVVCVATSTNTCISCGKEIPEGMLVCTECEVGSSTKRCTICDRPIAESDSICSNCRAVIFNLKDKN